MNEYSIELVDLTKRYRSFTAVDHLNLTIRKGEIFGLLGPNGAGKSTTILMMLGLTEPTLGNVKVCGIDSTRNPIEVKRKVGYLPEDVGFYDHYSGFENLMYSARLNGLSNQEGRKRAEKLLERIGLSDASSKKAGKYSRGMRQRLGLADVLIKNPEVIILDEPTLGIDPKGVREFLELIVSLSKEEGITVLFSSHHLHQVQQVCDRVGLFVSGKLLAEGNVQTLSEKLFSSSPYTVEVAIPGWKNDVDRLKDILKSIRGIKDIQYKNGLYHLECSGDLTAEIGMSIFQSGFDINYLSKKEYGLDDIYYRYFEGGENHE